MKETELSILMIICTIPLILAYDNDMPHCFKFTWAAPRYDNNPDRYNCSTHPTVPCIHPIWQTEKLPTVAELLQDKKNNTCLLTTGNVCIKYTFTFNNDIVNTTSFCGKIVEDQVTAVTSGCYEQQIDGYTIETCACVSKRDICNASVNLSYPGFLLLITLLFSFITFKIL